MSLFEWVHVAILVMAGVVTPLVVVVLGWWLNRRVHTVAVHAETAAIKAEDAAVKAETAVVKAEVAVTAAEVAAVKLDEVHTIVVESLRSNNGEG